MNGITLKPPAEARSTEITRFNALRHGVLSRYTVLPWEDADEYQALVAALASEHTPQGPTEEHLVEELAGILWRKRRLRLAEAASYRRGLNGTFASYQETAKVALVHLDADDTSEWVVDAIRATESDNHADIADMTADEALTRRALDRLGSKRNDAYEEALAALREDTRQWWADSLVRDPAELEDGEEPATADCAGLRRFIESEVLPWFETRAKELANRPLIREQAFGEALDPDKLERLGRYEVHLDRKLERMLAMLLHEEAIKRLQAEHKRLQDRIHAMYVDKLDGLVDTAFFDKMSNQWREEQNRCQREIDRHQSADKSYMDEGVQLLELARNAQRLFARQEPREKRRLLNFVLSNCTWGDGELITTFRQPFDMLAEIADIAARHEAENTADPTKNEIWLPEQDSNLRPID